jgi:thiol:disulfide interchange protein DsbC
MIRLLAVLLFGALVFPAHASDDTIRAAIETLVPNAKIDSIAEAVVPGLYEVILEGQIVYVSQDGKYLVQGSLFDIANKVDVTEQTRAGIRTAALKNIPKDQRIIFSPENPKHTLTVYTDIDCGYCRRMHQQVAELNKLGIALEYVFFPRSGPGTESWTKAVSVYCADDRRAALTDAKAGQPVPPKECANPVEQHFALGSKVGVNGTPAVFTEDGTQVGGYSPPDQLILRLDQLAAQKAAAN